MIECVIAADFAYWLVLMAEITTKISETAYVVHSAMGDVLWTLQHGDWCHS
jgi:hypothetical protein